LFTVEKALEIATIAHKGQTDKAGKEYIYHPIMVAFSVKTKEEKIVALLHDVVEDTKITLKDLKNYGVGTNELTAIKLLTKKNNEDYFEYIARIKTNNLARNVKIADLKHNSDLTRLKVITDKDLKRVEKYKKAIAYLTE
jgi:(p)ppGpp synthase/HD superfamily hydrolase